MPFQKKVVTLRRLPHFWTLYLLILPTLALVGIFAYYPAVSGVYHSFFDWDGGQLKEWVGLQNYREAFRDEVFLHSFWVLGVLVVTNLFKMLPPIITAVAIHRMVSDRWQYYYRVLFVIPMIIPLWVNILLWKFFYNPQVGILNRFLNASGLIAVPRFLDRALPALAGRMAPLHERLIDPLFGNLWGLFLFGLAILAAVPKPSLSGRRGFAWLVLAGAGLAAFRNAAFRFFPEPGAAARAGVAAAYTAWILGGALVAARLGMRFLPPMGGRAGRLPQEVLQRGAKALLGAAVLVALATLAWSEPTGAFETGQPAWLGHSRLIVPSIVFYGFPWVGVFGVLVYLAGLQNISQDVYEAADIDGVSWLGKFTRIELPLIATHIRLMLILMIIGVIQQFALVLVLVGPEGGPRGVAQVPGLYMFRMAFTEGKAGYGSAIGVVLFFLILALTLINQKFVRVEK